jgi:ABC-type Fe3+/spermidine/putrescine transport system ATPase subunit
MLDEPLSSLDTAVRQNLQEAIRRIQRELKITTLLVTHDIGEAMSMSDRIALLLDGKLVAVDTPEQLFHRPSCMSAARFMGVSTFLDGKQEGSKLQTSLGTLNISKNIEPIPITEKSHKSTFAIRPEHIQIQSESCENTIPGKVTNKVFRGEYIEYIVEVNDSAIRARMAMPAPIFPCGEKVQVNFPAERLFKVSAEVSPGPNQSLGSCQQHQNPK